MGSEGVYYDATYTNTPLSTTYNQKHIPGANARGANYVVTADSIYVAGTNTCHVLDPRTGGRLRSINSPAGRAKRQFQSGAFSGVEGDVLLGGAGFANYTATFGLATQRPSQTKPGHIGPVPGPIRPAVLDLSASKALVAFDRTTGKVLWRAEARHSFIHNGIVAGNGQVFCIDRLPKSTRTN